MCPESRSGACDAWTVEKYYTKWSSHIHSGSTALNTHHVKFTTGDSECVHNVVTAVITSPRTFPYLCFFTLTFHLVWSFLPPLNSCSGKTCIICDFSHTLAAILETVASWTLCCTPVLSIYAFAAELVNIATDCSDQTAERFNGIRENCYLASLGPLFCSAACQWTPAGSCVVLPWGQGSHFFILFKLAIPPLTLLLSSTTFPLVPRGLGERATRPPSSSCGLSVLLHLRPRPLPGLLISSALDLSSVALPLPRVSPEILLSWRHSQVSLTWRSPSLTVEHGLVLLACTACTSGLYWSSLLASTPFPLAAGLLPAPTLLLTLRVTEPGWPPFSTPSVSVVLGEPPPPPFLPFKFLSWLWKHDAVLVLLPP